MTRDDVAGVLEFLRSAERLKNVHRSAWTSGGERESVAEHTWRLCLMALVFRNSFPGVDFTKVVKICIVHDLGEALGGDIPAPEQVANAPKASQEREDLVTLVASLPTAERTEIVALWDEYETAESPEAKLAKALDKLETIMQHNQGKNPNDFDFRFNLDYGKRFTDAVPELAEVRRVLDEETEQRARELDS
jgi:putative hydrolases of HD superfamily